MKPPQLSNTAIVVVTYNPNNDFMYNIEQYLSIAKYLIVVDNASSIDINRLLPLPSLCGNRFFLVKLHSNMGIAYGLNVGIQFALNLSCEWVLTFDQDSFPNQNILYYYSKALNLFDNIGLIGTTFSNHETKITSISWKKTNTIITSGTLHHKSLFDKIGFYNERLFIDSVDFDFALRASLLGFLNLRANQPLISHHLGDPIKKMGISSSNHNSIRRYYAARNNSYLIKQYFKFFPIWILFKNLNYIVDLIKMLLVEKNRLEKIRFIIKGINDASKNFE